MHTRLLATGALAALVAVAVGCGGDDKGSSKSAGTSGAAKGNLTVYSSFPLQGAAKSQSTAVENGVKLALKQLGGQIGNFKVKHVALDDSTAQAGNWDPGQVSQNARKAVQDKSAVGYVGEFNSGASVVSIPILNQGGLLQVSPSNTYVGLTQPADKGEPDKYYPTGKRTYGRVIPPDDTQGRAQVTYQLEQGCKKVFVLNDKEVGGAGQAKIVAKVGPERGLDIIGNQGIDPKATNFRGLAANIKSKGADCVFFGGVTANGAVQLWKDLYASSPKTKLFGTDGVGDDEFVGGIGKAASVTYLTNATLDPAAYPPSGQKFFADYKATYGHEPEGAYAIYGYEAMAIVLQAIKDAGDQAKDRAAVIKAFFNIKNRESVLGTYSIKPSGDPTLSAYGAYVIENGKLKFSKTLSATGA
jgi:branched-chain amino acid transport system substrate-binding protein